MGLSLTVTSTRSELSAESVPLSSAPFSLILAVCGLIRRALFCSGGCRPAIGLERLVLLGRLVLFCEKPGLGSLLSPGLEGMRLKEEDRSAGDLCALITRMEASSRPAASC